ncbi:MAG TPA: MFS transporter [Candidatus Limnocylindrales bacterium]|nr:MFS transporter [Candidatus Limnocylindrales bacterium]
MSREPRTLLAREVEPLPADAQGTLGVLRNSRFRSLWLSQVATQVGGNMVLYGLTVLVAERTNSSASAVSLLLLTFLVPAVVFSAVAGVYVDRFDRRTILVAANLVRAVAFVVMLFLDTNLLAIYLLNIVVSTVTTLFAPAEASTIPFVVRREQLLAANGLFTFTLQASFAVGFAVLGPFLVILLGDVQGLLILVAALYLVAAGMCATLPPVAPVAEGAGFHATAALGEAEQAVAGTFGQLREGLAYIRANPSIFWSLSYLGITASLIGVLGALGPSFAQHSLGLGPKDFVVVVLPLGAGLVVGILLLNAYGRYLPRRRVIEGGMLTLAVCLGLLAVAAPLSSFLKARASNNGFVQLGPLVSLLAIVVVVAIVAGIAYALVAVPAQTQLQEELPADVRGRVFGVLNMLVSVASFVPIIVAGPVADLTSPDAVLLACGVLVAGVGLRSVVGPAPLRPVSAEPAPLGGAVDPVAVTAMPLARQPDAQQRPGEGR